MLRFGNRWNAIELYVEKHQRVKARIEQMMGRSKFAQMLVVASVGYLHSPYQPMIVDPPTQGMACSSNLEDINAHPLMDNR